MRLSVVLCTCNGAPYLPRQLASLAAQDRRCDELIVQDDASDDLTADVVGRFAAHAPFPVSLQVNARRLGITRNFETAAARATGDILFPCDQDDVWYPPKLSRLAECFDDPSVLLAFCDADLVEQDLSPMARTLWRTIGFTRSAQRLTERQELWRVLCRFNAVAGVTMAFRATLRPLLLPIPGTWIHDGWIALLASARGRCVALNEALVAYRQHPRQQIGPGPESVAGRIARARQMDRDYFLRLAANFSQTADRLAEQGVSGRAADEVRKKAAHAQRRAELREVAPAARLIRVAVGLPLYRRYALGWQSALQDLLLAPRS